MENHGMVLTPHIALVNNDGCCQHKIGQITTDEYRHALDVRTWATVTRQQHHHCKEYPPRPVVNLTDSEIHNNIKQKAICTRRDS